ncbi:DUF1684 domain-containing protein [Limibacter armeniacum]|uniref:DUF1684 domain-containing protein n=1 Tax=Limibacter armeniacum TaxID=466084 RepID=UPI002FE531A6
MKKVIGIIVLLGVVGSAFYMLSNTNNEQNVEMYMAEIEAFRKENHEKFLKESESPLEQEDRAYFEGLKYFEPDPVFNVKADLEWVGFKDVMTVKTSKGNDRRYVKKAYAVFTLKGEEYRVALLQDEFPIKGMENLLILAFTDETSGHETYGAGRYINLEVKGNQKQVDLDFNKAYNPYCAYNTNYDCVIPPQGNHLDIQVLAGEKTYKSHD